MNSDRKNNKNWNYEETVAQVEKIIEQIESGSLPLEEVFEKFAIAIEHLRECESFLAIGKERMNLLIETLEQEEDIEF
ncbi:MAG: exodeoxyribonuclease VII small subunit [Hydrococcus sp. C42_A2020_068]|uniref:exodeoxyribonuclease VII small subunit n=1 Tax=Pleurocapsa sp. PCC 7327 TaxID=118163 RepID=UPI00029FC75A|nr:exodeoxyribonuclease VII small subunit [Pleurocapsa sp. PCC 7327]AFY75571.1 exonuclease VII small subunit [Pleurocapsa sp. PCC 7327]MBF2022062.1 exodeoxyribonuclease VII small subunit [Hydrococcus sp. C42_A2020_068]